MDLTNNSEFIHAYDLFPLTSLQVKDVNDLKFYVYKKGWVTALRADLPWTTIYCDGHFPAKLVKTKTLLYEATEYSPRYEKTAFILECSLSSKYGHIGLTDFKRNELGLEPEDSIEDVYFKHEAIDPDFVSIGSAGGYCLFILKSDLFSYCEKHGVFDIQDRYNSLVSKRSQQSEPDPIPSLVSPDQDSNFHPNTSQAMLVLVEANNYFWANFDPNDPAETAPTKEQVTEWLINKGYSPSLAGSMDTVLRDGRSKPGGRPEKT